jgi:hypothetical protein
MYRVSISSHVNVILKTSNLQNIFDVTKEYRFRFQVDGRNYSNVFA